MFSKPVFDVLHQTDRPVFWVAIVAGFSMTIGLKAGQLDIRVGAPNEFRNHTKGLMGVFNGDPNDDLLAPGENAVALSNASSEWAIYYDFGEKCTFCML